VTGLAIPPTGPHALFNQPGVGIARRRRRKRTKAANWGAHVGQAIAGRLTRGEGGRFSGDGQASAAKPPSKSREHRTALRAARQERMDALRAARAAEQEAEAVKRAEEDAYIAEGTTGRERQKRRAEIAAARRERAAARKATHQHQLDEERVKRAEEDAAPPEKGAEEQPKKGGGGGGGKKKPSEEEKRTADEQKKAANRAATAPKAGLSTTEAEFLAGVASGTQPAGSFDGRHLAELGLTQDTGDTTEATDAGRRALAALERGDVRGALAAIQDGKARLAHDRARAEKKRQVAQRRRRLPKGPVRQTTKALAVFKDAQGHDRWLAITTTAYEDKDREFITRKAIRGVVAAGDAGAPRGPLRFWHVPGLDLGDCDYQATAYDDRFLIESGTFRSPAAARIGQKAAQLGYQMSPGFLHTHQEPRGGSFDHIALFERSFVPPGRASNPYTRLLTKEARMLTPEKQKEFESLADSDEGRALLTRLLTQASTTVKAADDAGAVYKDAPVWAQALLGRLDGMEAQLKAFPPVAAAADEQAAAEDDDLAAMETETADDGMGMDDEGFADMIVDKLFARLGPMLDLEKKVAGYLDSMKGMLQPMQQKDDARAQELATLQVAVDAGAKAGAALAERLKALEGDLPRGALSYRADVWQALSGIPVTKEQAAALTTKQTPGVPAGLNGAEADAYKLIYGDS